jgi:hypothetical protein
MMCWPCRSRHGRAFAEVSFPCDASPGAGPHLVDLHPDGLPDECGIDRRCRLIGAASKLGW